MSEPVKDFEYYADKAEIAVVESGKVDPGSRHTEWQMNVAELYARLAAAAAASPPSEPESVESRMIWRHADGCPCTVKG